MRIAISAIGDQHAPERHAVQLGFRFEKRPKPFLAFVRDALGGNGWWSGQSWSGGAPAIRGSSAFARAIPAGSRRALLIVSIRRHEDVGGHDS